MSNLCCIICVKTATTQKLNIGKWTPNYCQRISKICSKYFYPDVFNYKNFNWLSLSTGSFLPFCKDCALFIEKITEWHDQKEAIETSIKTAVSNFTLNVLNIRKKKYDAAAFPNDRSIPSYYAPSTSPYSLNKSVMKTRLVESKDKLEVPDSNAKFKVEVVEVSLTDDDESDDCKIIEEVNPRINPSKTHIKTVPETGNSSEIIKSGGSGSGSRKHEGTNLGKSKHKRNLFLCKDCEKRYSCERQLKAHKCIRSKINLEEESKVFCKICKRTFQNKRRLATHKRKFHAKEVLTNNPSRVRNGMEHGKNQGCYRDGPLEKRLAEEGVVTQSITNSNNEQAIKIPDNLKAPISLVESGEFVNTGAMKYNIPTTFLERFVGENPSSSKVTKQVEDTERLRKLFSTANPAMNSQNKLSTAN